MSRKELEFVLDFILNRAEGDEFQVILKACERKKRESVLFSKAGGANPDKMAKQFSQNINEQIGASMDGIRETVKGFVEDIIRKNAPELSDAQVREALDSYVPDPKARADREQGKSKLPPEAIAGMVKDFLDYTAGSMPPSRQKELWDMMPRWQDQYWSGFPPKSAPS